MKISRLLLVSSGVVCIAAVNACCGKKSDPSATDADAAVPSASTVDTTGTAPRPSLIAKPHAKGGAAGSSGAGGAGAAGAPAAGGTGGATAGKAGAGGAGSGGAKAGPVIRIPGRK